jgi:hypothetical protein
MGVPTSSHRFTVGLFVCPNLPCHRSLHLRKELKADQVMHKLELSKISNLAGANRDELIRSLEELFTT